MPQQPPIHVFSPSLRDRINTDPHLNDVLRADLSELTDTARDVTSPAQAARMDRKTEMYYNRHAVRPKTNIEMAVNPALLGLGAGLSARSVVDLIAKSSPDSQLAKSLAKNPAGIAAGALTFATSLLKQKRHPGGKPYVEEWKERPLPPGIHPKSERIDFLPGIAATSLLAPSIAMAAKKRIGVPTLGAAALGLGLAGASVGGLNYLAHQLGNKKHTTAVKVSQMTDEAYLQARKIENDIAGAYLGGGVAYALNGLRPGDMSGTVWNAIKTSPTTKRLGALLLGGAALEGARRAFWHSQGESAMPMSVPVAGIPIGLLAAKSVKSPAIAAPLAAALSVAANRLIMGQDNDRMYESQKEILNRFAEGDTSPLSF